MRNVSGELSYLGFRPHDVAGFQRAYNLGPRLKVDAAAGPLTLAALANSVARSKAGKPNISEHFSAHEFSCECHGKYATCKRIYLRRDLLKALEKTRAYIDAPLPIVSGYRCPQHNLAVGGATDSQHKHASAADIPGVLSLAQARNLKAFSGLGVSRNGKVVHVDIRHLVRNTTGGTPLHPTVWYY